jgi:DNA-binding NarL/FixJ family response regulator
MSHSTTASIRLILADDHSIVLDGLRRLFESQPDFEVVRCCADGASALAAVRAEPIDVLVLDLRMPGLTGLDVLKAMAEDHVDCRTVLLTAALRDDEVVEAVRLGAMGVVLKESKRCSSACAACTWASSGSITRRCRAPSGVCYCASRRRAKREKT